MNTTPMARSRRAGAVVAVGALALSGLVFAAPAQAAEKVLTPVDVDTSATRAKGHNDFRSDGVRVWTEGSTDTGQRTDNGAPDAAPATWNVDKAAGYFDVNQLLADVGEPSMDWSNNDPNLIYPPGLQMKTDFDGDGDIDGILVGEPTILGNNWWVSEAKAEVKANPNVPLIPSEPDYREYQGTLDDWRAAFPDAAVLEGGWSLGSGAHGDGVIYGMTFGDTNYLFSKDETRTDKVLYPTDVVHTDTRSLGHNDFRSTSGVRVWTEDNSSESKATGYFDVNESLRSVGEPTLAWRANGANTHRPGLQMVIDINGDDAPDGILVGERSYANDRGVYQDIATATNWWLSLGSATPELIALAPSDDGGTGSSANGTLAEWRAALPADTEVLKGGWSLGSGVKGDGVIEGITYGLTTYTFTGKNRAPEAGDVTGSSKAGVDAVVTLIGSDPDGDDIVFETSTDGATIEGDQLTIDVASDFVGYKNVNYTVTDESGASAEGTVKVAVGRALATVSLATTPKSPKSSQSVKANVQVTTTGYLRGATVDIYDGSKKLKSGVLYSNGKVNISIGKLKKGTHKLVAKFRGSTFTIAKNSATLKVVVK